MSQEELIAELEAKVETLEKAMLRLLRGLSGLSVPTEVQIAAGEAYNVLLGVDE